RCVAAAFVQKIALVQRLTSDREPNPYTNYDELTTEQAMLDTRHRLQPFEGQTEIHYIEGYDTEFCAALAASGVKLDFVYVDSSHRYEKTLQELEAVAPIIADDGVILGDDWIIEVTHRHHGLMRAVNEFLKMHSGWRCRRAGCAMGTAPGARISGRGAHSLR